MAEDASVQDTTMLDKKIIQQVEYYFGDMNLPRDRFLQEEMKKDEDGWIPLEVMTKFNRLKILSDNVEVIASALKKSTNDLVEINDDSTKIRRAKSKPLPENRLEFWQQMKSRTLYVKGFPEDSQLDQIMEFFSKYGTIENVLMRRTKDTKRNFKGSVFVTFANRDLAQAFLDAGAVKYGETELIRLFEADYFKSKMEERKQMKLKRQEEKDAAKQQQDDKRNKRGEKCDEVKFVAGRVLHLKNLPEKNTDRDRMKQNISEHGQVDWIDYNRGDKEAFIRIVGNENCAEKVLNSLKEKSQNCAENKVKVGEIECEADILTGDEEKNYWVKTNEDKKAALERKGNFKKNRGNKDNFKDKHFNKRRGGGRGGGRDRGDRRNDDRKSSQNGDKEDKSEKTAENDDKEMEKDAKETKTNEKDTKMVEKESKKEEKDAKTVEMDIKKDGKGAKTAEIDMKTDEKPKPAETATKRRAESDASAEPEVKSAKIE